MKKCNLDIKSLIITACCAIVVLVVWYNWPSSVFQIKGISDYSTAGTHGDMFGGLNALFTGLAAVGLIYTILLQRTEIQMAMGEIENAARLSKKRDFEQIFLKWLDRLDQHISASSISLDAGCEKGVKAIEGMYQVFKKYEIDDGLEHLKTGKLDFLYATQWPAKIHRATKEVCRDFPVLSGFFEITEIMIMELHSAPVSDKQFYVNLFKFSCSKAGLAFMFYKFAIDRKLRVICHELQLFHGLENSGYMLAPNDKLHISNPNFMDDLR